MVQYEKVQYPSLLNPQPLSLVLMGPYNPTINPISALCERLKYRLYNDRRSITGIQMQQEELSKKYMIFSN